ncbi:integrase catalytic domain-containing protein [Trichonephila clavipes]|nr:integrase catalytic domain-containing protein [Trichonephila clavipes]
MAMHRLQQIEHRFSENKSLSDQYHKFMNDYLKLGHMELIPELLTRIAYGTASAPYLAIKCLQQSAINEANNFPLASKAALNDFFVDDLMSGANSFSEALEVQNQLTQILSSAGLVLRKWASNCNELLNSIDSDMRLSNASLNIDNDDTVKTLAILWHLVSNVFYFKITHLSFEGTLTKRTLLSTIAKTFDPLGWLSPITIQYKTTVQRLETTVAVGRKDNQFHLFGFSDASEKANAAAIYCCSVSDTGKINVQLIIAKTRVSPLKPVSLPQLELCGALLLVKLMDFTCKALNSPISETQFYMDSTIVLAWIESHANRWKTLVGNRVAKIQMSSATQWHHISGSVNPVDLATRGVSSSTLLTSTWFCSHKFLHETFPFQTDSSFPSLNDVVPEERAIHLELVTDLSADAFIAALKRFISHRGKCSDIYSDSGSNFVGAKRKLMEFEKLAKSDSYNQNVSKFLNDNDIKWHQNVPGAPHMGGLWEAGIKSTKYHLKRVVGETKLTYEEFETFLTQIEACLNCIPLTPISNDPNDLSALMPGHFIIGRPLTSIPEPNYIDSNNSYLTKWQQIQKLVQQFWKLLN